MSHEETIREAFPEIEDIEDDDLREGVLSAWSTTLEETGTDLDAAPWYPPAQDELGLTDARLVPHVRDVTEGAIALAEIVAKRNRAVADLETVIAGALVHDVSKPYEFEGLDATEIQRLLGHPHFGIHVAARAGLPMEVVHIVASHSPATAVEPATIEAEIVRRADEVAAATLRAGAVDDLREL